MRALHSCAVFFSWCHSCHIDWERPYSRNTLFAKHSTHNYLIFHIYCWCVTGDGTAQHKNAHVKRKTIMKNDARMFKTHKWYNMRFVTHKYMECNAFTCVCVCFFSLVLFLFPFFCVCHLSRAYHSSS